IGASALVQSTACGGTCFMPVNRSLLSFRNRLTSLNLLRASGSRRRETHGCPTAGDCSPISIARSSLVAIALALFLSANLQGQTPVREYIYLGDRLLSGQK